MPDQTELPGPIPNVSYKAVDIPPFQLEIIRKEAALESMRHASSARRIAFLAGVGTGLSPVVALTQDWKDFYKTPTFTGLAMGVVFSMLGAVYVERNMWSRIREDLNSLRGDTRKRKGV